MGGFSIGYIETDFETQRNLDILLAKRENEEIGLDDPDVFRACDYDEKKAKGKNKRN